MSDDIRSRAIAYAREQPLSADMIASLGRVGDAGDCIAVLQGQCNSGGEFYIVSRSNMPAFRIGLDNMLANAFEIAYAAGVEERDRPKRALRDSRPIGTKRKVVKPKK